MSTIPVSAENHKTLDGVETAEYSESYLQYLEDVKSGDTAKYNGVIPFHMKWKVQHFEIRVEVVFHQHINQV